MKKLEKLLKAFANARRLEILKNLLEKKDLTVGQLSKRIKLSFKSTSRHLAVLFAADLVEKDQHSLEMRYRICQKQVTIIKTILNLK